MTDEGGNDTEYDTPEQSRCSHKFIDSTRCLKCGWEAPRKAAEPKEPTLVELLKAIKSGVTGRQRAQVLRALALAEQAEAAGRWIQARDRKPALPDTSTPEWRMSEWVPVTAHGRGTQFFKARWTPDGWENDRGEPFQGIVTYWWEGLPPPPEET